MKFCKPAIFMFLIVFVGAQANAQSVILINEEATKVELENGEIKTIYEKLPRYMDGFTKAPRDVFKKFPLLSLSEFPIVVSREEPRKPVIEPVIVPPKEREEEKEENSNLGDDNIRFGYSSAILQKTALSQIKDLASSVKLGEYRSIILKAWYQSGDKNSQELVKNRLDACKAYLVANGVLENLINISLIGSNRESNFVAVNLQ